MKDRTHRIYMTPEDGQAVWESPGQFERIVASLKPGLRHEVTVRPYRRNATAEQRRYYWGVMMRIMETDGSGYTAEEWHQIFAEQFLSYEKDGRKFVRSTEDLTTVEREDYHSKVRQEASIRHQVYLPLPNEVHWTEG